MSKLPCVALLLAISTLAPMASAVCSHSASEISDADRDLFNALDVSHTSVFCGQNNFDRPSCPSGKTTMLFSDWHKWAYDIRSDWSNRGLSLPGSLEQEYAKHMTAAYLVTYGLNDNGGQSYHGQTDYRGAAEKHENQFHDALRHLVTDDTSVYGRWERAIFGSDELYTSCSLYDVTKGGSRASPGSRAGDFVHESWHAWRNKYLGVLLSDGHVSNPSGGFCKMSGAACDYFFLHGVGAYSFGDMWFANIAKALPISNAAAVLGPLAHSPNQVQVEFLCDVSDPETSKTWVPTSVRTSASWDANDRLFVRFTNNPGFVCGTNRPW